ncbi:hypothetical protein PA7_44920 [Pseudonocardia asaccharolytica DSM 44247 = NBRC 16224]|uniref:Bacterial transcriptional activator domain-containing protein n=1 Tax=Pseudonocardia asaccharolytica DSM 44247 = NBRC 16224 TaxID=1123024 RepID=A0A511D776_9PSEU|nr:hypothetical protein PA7_44920 [Pseudonocardia asaccharolytica DSM 44247 = NBRC 16224]
MLLGEGAGQEALGILRGAWAAWQELSAPYEAARARALMGLARRELGDDESAEMELDAARWVFQHLGPGPTWPASRRSRGGRSARRRADRTGGAGAGPGGGRKDQPGDRGRCEATGE